MALIGSSRVFIDRKYLIVFVVDMQVVLTKSSMWRILSHRVWPLRGFPRCLASSILSLSIMLEG